MADWLRIWYKVEPSASNPKRFKTKLWKAEMKNICEKELNWEKKRKKKKVKTVQKEQVN